MSSKTAVAHYVPGISYIPDKLEVAENRKLMIKLESEFLDFITCIVDILDLIHVVKTKQLRSMMPLPHDVIREIRLFRNKGPLYKSYDRTVGATAVGISQSVDDVLKSASTHSANKPQRSALTKKDVAKKRPLEAELVKITGKKTKPMWHQVATEKVDIFASRVNKLKEEKGQAKSEVSEATAFAKAALSGKNAMSRTKSENLVFSIKFATSNLVKPSTDQFKKQMDMMEASAAGFKSVDEHRIHIETLKPHWFTDLLQAALHAGIAQSQEVKNAFESLGAYYSLSCNSLHLAKVKICFVVMSLPLWDIMRMTVQRAFEFILQKILLDPDATKALKTWLAARKLSYIVAKPTYSLEHNHQQGGSVTDSEQVDNTTEPESEDEV